MNEKVNGGDCLGSYEAHNHPAEATCGRKKQEKDFDEILRFCIESTFREVLGEATTATILYHIGSERLSEGIEFFAETLERLFGSGAFLLERLILEKLYRHIEKKFNEKANYKFSDYVKEAKAEWLKESK